MRLWNFPGWWANTVALATHEEKHNKISRMKGRPRLNCLPGNWRPSGAAGAPEVPATPRAAGCAASATPSPPLFVSRSDPWSSLLYLSWNVVMDGHHSLLYLEMMSGSRAIFCTIWSNVGLRWKSGRILWVTEDVGILLHIQDATLNPGGNCMDPALEASMWGLLNSFQINKLCHVVCHQELRQLYTNRISRRLILLLRISPGLCIFIQLPLALLWKKSSTHTPHRDLSLIGSDMWESGEPLFFARMISVFPAVSSPQGEMFVRSKKGPPSVRRKAFPPTTKVSVLPRRSVVEFFSFIVKGLFIIPPLKLRSSLSGVKYVPIYLAE